jgi:hypothetical protein
MSAAIPHRPAASTAAGRHAHQSLGAERSLRAALGLIWLADGVLQLQPFMFTRSFVTEIIAPNTAGQPGFVAWPITVAEHLIEPRVALFNAFAAALQILIGLGILYRPTVRIALLGSIGWALSVWWIGEGLGGLFTPAASPFTGAPGAALLYVLASLIIWPRTSRQAPRSWQAGRHLEGGILGKRGALVAWAILWLGSAALWLLPANRTTDAVHDQIAHAPSGASSLSSIQASLAATTEGHGAIIAIAGATLSAAIGLAALLNRWKEPSVALTVVLALIYFVAGQGMGGILTGTGTDPGTGPLLVWLALAIYAIRRPNSTPAVARARDAGRPKTHIGRQAA